MDLAMLGWNAAFEEHLRSWREHSSCHVVPARVASVHKRRYLVYTADGDTRRELGAITPRSATGCSSPPAPARGQG